MHGSAIEDPHLEVDRPPLFFARMGLESTLLKFTYIVEFSVFGNEGSFHSGLHLLAKSCDY